jgi:NAD(P)-dependent dehydrogenase (short-subunit alcohol dehydrogenase family)
MATRLSCFSQIIAGGNDFVPLRLVYNLLSNNWILYSNGKLHRAVIRKLPSVSNKRFSTTTETPTKTALIVGSSGCLGSSIVSHLYEHQIATKIIGVDVVSPPQQKYLNRFISLGGVDPSNDASLIALTNEVKKGFQQEDVKEENVKFDAIICTAGGFLPTSDYSQSEDFFNGVEEMIHKNLFPVLMATHIAATKLKPGGEYNLANIAFFLRRVFDFLNCYFIISNFVTKCTLLKNKTGLFVAIGAAAALGPAPGLLAYGISKNAVNYIVQTIGQKGELIRISEQKPTVVAILPSMLDTPANREQAPEGTDFSKWTKVEHIAEEIGQWIKLPDLRPNSGSLVKVIYHSKSGKSVFRLVR